MTLSRVIVNVVKQDTLVAVDLSIHSVISLLVKCSDAKMACVTLPGVVVQDLTQGHDSDEGQFAFPTKSENHLTCFGHELVWLLCILTIPPFSSTSEFLES